MWTWFQYLFRYLVNQSCGAMSAVHKKTPEPEFRGKVKNALTKETQIKPRKRCATEITENTEITEEAG